MTPPQPRTTSLNATIAVTTSIVGVVVAATIRSYDASVVAPGLGAAIAVVYRTLNHLQPRPDTPRVAPA